VSSDDVPAPDEHGAGYAATFGNAQRQHRHLADIDRAMRRIRRSQTRRSQIRLAARTDNPGINFGTAAGTAGTAGTECGTNPALVSVVDAVDEGPPAAGEQVTVGLVAERLGIDPSRASRLVAASIQSGHLVRVASQRDGRRIGLELTGAGREVLEATQRFRYAMFAKAMHDWTDDERTEFARLLTRFTSAFIEATGC
jgi:DNA-binding MarR family transcriptional regulator